MSNYQKILLAVVLDEKSDQQLIVQAQRLTKQFNAELHLLHAIEHLSSYGAAYGVAAGADIEEMLMENASQEMDTLAEKMQVDKDHYILKVGPAKCVILEEAERMGVGLIVIGSHGRHGIRLLLGSTANAVLHGAKCDVLAVRLKE